MFKNGKILKKEVIRVANAVINGDHEARINSQLNGNDKEMVDALNTMLDTIKTREVAVTNEVLELANAVVEGKLDRRADVRKFQGNHRSIVKGINDTLDAVVEPLNIAAEYFERISKGEIPEKITDNYRGDFNEIKNNLNRMIDHVGAQIGNLANIPTPIMTIDRDFNISYMNTTGAKLVGLTPQECKGKKCYDLFKTPHCNTPDCRCDQAMQTDNIVTGETIADPEGLNIPIQYTGAPIKDKEGNIIGALEYVVDITETKKAMDDSKEKVDFLNNIPTPVMVVDRGMNVRFMNPAGAGAVGLTPEACLGKKCFSLFNTNHCNTSDCQVAKAIENDGIFTNDTVASLPSGELPIRYTGAPLKDAEGNIVGALEYVVDITKEVDITTEVLDLVNAAIEGKLNKRANVAKFEGNYKNIVQGVNDTMDAIVVPINDVKRVVESIGDGDLTKFIEVETQGDLKDFADSVETMQKNLRTLIGEVQESSVKVASTAEEMSASSEQMTSASNQISDTVSEIARGAQEQSGKTEAVSAAMNDMTRTVQEVAGNAQKAAEGANEANQLSQGIGKISKELSAKMTDIQNAVGDSSNVIQELDIKSKQIGEIVSLITNIADQTNLLALNAAIEAARAGEYGRGFAVVADEVRKLAEESGTAAKQIANLIHEIQAGSADAVTSMHRGTEEVEKGAESLNETVDAIANIVTVIGSVSNMVQDIAAAAEEQSASIEEVSASVQDVSAISEESASGTQEASAAVEQQTASMQELAKSAEELTRMAEGLQEAVSRFKLDSEK